MELLPKMGNRETTVMSKITYICTVNTSIVRSELQSFAGWEWVKLCTSHITNTHILSLVQFDSKYSKVIYRVGQK